MKIQNFGLSCGLILIGWTANSAELVIADFEGGDYRGWKASGSAFGERPALGALEKQNPVTNFIGRGLANSFSGGDGSVGTLSSPIFEIQRKFITFYIGGGGWVDETCMNLLIDGKVVRTATGENIKPGGVEALEPRAWDVGEYLGREASITIVDRRQGMWGHINVDQIVQTADRGTIELISSKVALQKEVKVEVSIAKRWLHFPVKNGAKKRMVSVSADGKVIRRFEIELADDEPDWWAPLDLSAWMGKPMQVVADALPEGSKALAGLCQADQIVGVETLYQEALRPGLQFSSKRGWMNDPNGMVYYNGEYHLFFQHNPYGWGWGNMHWGHATSRDLVHWEEHGEALYPDEMGPMFSGSAVVDWKNTSGFGQDGKPPLILIYTAAGNPTTQCIAYSNDGRTFTKFSGNPVLKEVTAGNRDPKVFWHEPSKHWVMVLYVGVAGTPIDLDAKGKSKVRHTIQFFRSLDLRQWELASVIEGGSGENRFLYECPDFFELAIDGNPAKKKWVLTAANSDYAIGTFDGQRFTVENSELKGQVGRGFYAAQTFSDLPDGRRIQIGWGQMPSPGMAFNQLQTFPCELTLASTPGGARLRWNPVKELDSLRRKGKRIGSMEMEKGSANPLAGVNGELLEINAEFTPASDSEVTFRVRGITIRYDATKGEISGGGMLAKAPLQEGQQQIRILVDRTSVSIWASSGLVYLPFPAIAKAEDLGIDLQVTGGAISFKALEAYELQSIWTK